MMETEENLSDIRKKVAARVEAEAFDTQCEEEDDITPQFIKGCLLANENGDGDLFALLQRDKFIFNKSDGLWYRWQGHHWAMDWRESAYHAVNAVALKYLEEADRLAEQISEARAAGEEGKAKRVEDLQKKYRRRAHKLRTSAGAKNCLDWSHRIEGGLRVNGEEFDCNPWLLACKNGVVELRTGRFRDGRPGDYLIKAVPHDWKDYDHPAPTWEKFLFDVFSGDEELIAYVQRLFGYGITGLSTEHILPVLHGAGRNGKGTLVETLRYVLGPLAQPIQSEMLLEQRSARASSGPSPDIMALKGLRLAFASETDEGRKFSTSKAKWLSGGDTLTGRNPHDRHEVTFDPTHLLCLLTNHLPHAPGDDFAFWQRVHLVPFKIHFIDDPKAENERPRDKGLPEKLKEEAPGILAWLVRGCIDWQRYGLNPPLEVRSATERYRMNEDTIAEFLEACCDPPAVTDPEDRVQHSEIHGVFKEWFEANIGDPKYCPRRKKFTQLMERRFEKKKAGGRVWFYGVRLKPGYERE